MPVNGMKSGSTETDTHTDTRGRKEAESARARLHTIAYYAAAACDPRAALAGREVRANAAPAEEPTTGTTGVAEPPASRTSSSGQALMPPAALMRVSVTMAPWELSRSRVACSPWRRIASCKRQARQDKSTDVPNLSASCPAVALRTCGGSSSQLSGAGMTSRSAVWRKCLERSFSSTLSKKQMYSFRITESRLS